MRLRSRLMRIFSWFLWMGVVRIMRCGRLGSFAWERNRTLRDGRGLILRISLGRIAPNLAIDMANLYSTYQ